ncbi:MAG TPA: hypothetical protein VLA89_19020 [Gemmatimonadales bacterium]|nr:hypothetical protein [Gemmatimonadales bacterium]
MIEIKTRWKSVTDREKWAARGASFVAKAKATKVVWFPPNPVETGERAALTAKKATKGATKKTTGAAKKTTKGATKKTSGAARKTTNGTKSVTNPVRRRKA